MRLENIVIPSFVSIFLTVLMVEAVLGILSNVFIVSVNLQSWIKRQSLSSSDHIVVALAFSNAGFSCMNTLTTIIVISYQDILLMDNSLFEIIYCLVTYSVFSSSWLNAWLCLFFFLKINTFTSGFLSWLKTNLVVLVPWLILLSQIISFVSCLPLIWTISKVYAVNATTTGTTNNQTAKVTGYHVDPLYHFYSLAINSFIPFMVVMVTTGRVITSLCSHTRHMQENMGSSGEPNLKALQGAARTMTSLLILYLIFYVVEVSVGFFPITSPMYWVCYVAMSSFSTVESVLLITGNSKLKQACERTLRLCRHKG